MTPARRRLIEVLSDGLLHGKSEAARGSRRQLGRDRWPGRRGHADGRSRCRRRRATARPIRPSRSLNSRASSAPPSMRCARWPRAAAFMSRCSMASPAPARPKSISRRSPKIIRRGRQSLILMPEIALTGQFLDRFAQRFGVRPLEWHSELTPRTRARNWAAISAGEAPVVVGRALGAVSALCRSRSDRRRRRARPGLQAGRRRALPRPRHGGGARSHRQNPDRAGLRHAVDRDRGQCAQGPLPARIALPSRFGGQHMPHIEAIDLRRAPPPRGRFISPRLAEQIQFAIERREQALLFLNRRGYAPLTLCRACGHRFACTICDAWLVDHRFRQRLVCHHCGFSMPRPHICPHCAAEESLVAVGPGVERLQEEAAATASRTRAPWCCRATSSPRSRPCAAN